MADEPERKRAFDQEQLQRAALMLLLEQHGGTLTFTEAEYQAVAARFGGPSRLAMNIEVAEVPTTGEREITLTLVGRAPSNGRLVS